MQTGIRSTRDGLWIYLALTFTLSWIVWFLIPVLGMTGRTFPGILLYMVGGFAPSIMGVIMLFQTTPKADRADFWRRVWDVRRVHQVWWVLLVVGLPVLTFLAIWLDGVINGGAAGMEALKLVLAQPAELVGLIIVGVVAGPLSEELGWRGFALDRMIARWGMTRASLILGIIWWVWHLPLFFIPDTSHYSWGLFTLPFWSFLFTVIGLSVVIARAYSENGRSIFAAVLAHFVYNFLLALVFPITGGMMLIFAVLLWICVAVLFLRQPQTAQAKGAV